jgi:hypothetical protein
MVIDLKHKGEEIMYTLDVAAIGAVLGGLASTIKIIEFVIGHKKNHVTVFNM